MRTLTIFWAFFLFPLTLLAQSGSDALSQVTFAMANQNWDQATVFFHKAVVADVAKSEMYYWTEVDKNSAVCPLLARELALSYQTARNYDKAYLFYKELTQMQPNNVANLLACANMQMLRGKEKDALSLYERVLDIDRNNLSANIFVGNFYYLAAEQEKQKIETDFKKISAPTRMQYARYRDSLNRVVATGYSKAKEYLQNVLQRFPSVEAQKTLNKIQLIEKAVNR